MAYHPYIKLHQGEGPGYCTGAIQKSQELIPLRNFAYMIYRLDPDPHPLVQAGPFRLGKLHQGEGQYRVYM